MLCDHLPLSGRNSEVEGAIVHFFATLEFKDVALET